MDRKRAAPRPHLDVTYTKQYKEGAQKSTSKLIARNLGDAAYIVGPVVVGNAGVAIVKLVETVFNMDHTTQWFKPLHKQRKEERPNRRLKPHYKEQKFRWDADANHAAARMEKANRSDEQKKYEARLEIFKFIRSTLEADPDNADLFATVNACVLAGLQDVAAKGLISQEACNVVTSDNLPGIYSVGMGHGVHCELKLPGTAHDRTLVDQCMAAIAKHYMRAGLVTDDMREKAEYPKNEQDAYLSSESDQQQFENSSSGSLGGAFN
jgi:hypothetical protein